LIEAQVATSAGIADVFCTESEAAGASILIKLKNNKLFATASLSKSPNLELVPLRNKGIVRCGSEKD